VKSENKTIHQQITKRKAGVNGHAMAVVAEIRCKLSVVVATHRRASQLERMLTSMEQQTVDRRDVTIIVVENGSRDQTHEILADKSSELNILALWERLAGKARAVNRALEYVHGDLVVFTDDDITASPAWLRAYQSASRKFAAASLFCGPVIPELPVETPQWLCAHPLLSSLFFGRFEPLVAEGPLPEPLSEVDLPFGANFAVRPKALKTARFNHGLGPSEENGPLYDEDTEFLTRLHSRYGEFIYVPDARVIHHLEPRQIERPVLFEKVFHFGRTTAIRKQFPFFPPPASKVHSKEQDALVAEEFEKGCRLNFLSGQLHEFRLHGRKRFETMLEKALKPLDVPANRDMLSTSARMSATGDSRLCSQPMDGAGRSTQ
jgi:glycosyltransferase involved in cell wall biosynthesis